MTLFLLYGLYNTAMNACSVWEATDKLYASKQISFDIFHLMHFFVSTGVCFCVCLLGKIFYDICVLKLELEPLPYDERVY